MESLRGSAYKVVALLLCYSLCFSTPLGLAQDSSTGQSQAQPAHREKYVSGELQGDDRILQALNRFTFGPRPGDVEAVRQMGLETWFDQQLQPEAMDETDLNARLAQYPAMTWSTQDLLFRMPSNAIIRQAANGKIEIPSKGTLHGVYENSIYRIQVRKEAKAEKQTANANAEEPSQVSESRPGAPAGQRTNSSMDANPSMSPNATGEMTGAQPAMNQQQDMNAMAPAATDAAPAHVAAGFVVFPSRVDQRLIASVTDAVVWPVLEGPLHERGLTVGDGLLHACNSRAARAIRRGADRNSPLE